MDVARLKTGDLEISLITNSNPAANINQFADVRSRFLTYFICALVQVLGRLRLSIDLCKNTIMSSFSLPPQVFHIVLKSFASSLDDVPQIVAMTLSLSSKIRKAVFEELLVFFSLEK